MVVLDLALALAPGLFGAAWWRRHGASWRAIFSWVIPITVLLLAGLLWVEGISGVALTLAGAALFGAMMLSDRFAIWWERSISRTRRLEPLGET